MVFEHADEYPSQWKAIESIAAKLGINHETMRIWMRRAETDVGLRPGLTTDERSELRELQREVKPVSKTTSSSQRDHRRRELRHSGGVPAPSSESRVICKNVQPVRNDELHAVLLGYTDGYTDKMSDSAAIKR